MARLSMARALPGIYETELTSARMLVLFTLVLLVFIATCIAIGDISDEKERESAGIFAGVIPFAVLVFLLGFGRWTNYNTIVNTPTSRPSGVAAGFVEVYGEALAKGEYLISPFCGEECVFYKYQVREVGGRGFSLKGDSGNFLVRDRSGGVEVDPYGAEFETGSWKSFYIKSNEKTPERISRFIEELRKDYWWSPSSAVFKNRNMVYQEYVIEKGKKIFITGTAVPWYDLSSGKYVPKIIIKRGKDNGFFYISKKEEKDLLRDMRDQAILFIIGGGLATIVGVWYILLKLKVL